MLLVQGEYSAQVRAGGRVPSDVELQLILVTPAPVAHSTQRSALQEDYQCTAVQRAQEGDPGCGAVQFRRAIVEVRANVSRFLLGCKRPSSVATPRARAAVCTRARVRLCACVRACTSR